MGDWALGLSIVVTLRWVMLQMQSVKHIGDQDFMREVCQSILGLSK